MKSVKDNKNTYTLYEVENQLFAILGKKKAKFSLQPNKESLIDITQKENKQKVLGKFMTICSTKNNPISIIIRKNKEDIINVS